MRRFLTVFLVAASCTLASTMAWAGSQEIAEQIGKNIRSSGQLNQYKLAVAYDDGTAELTGRVRSREQMMSALKVAIETPGVERVVNNISVDSNAPEARSVAPTAAAARTDARAPGERGLFDRLEAATAAQKPPRGQQTAGSYHTGVRQIAAVEPEAQPSRGAQGRPLPIGYLQGAPQADPSGGGPAPMPMYTAAASRGSVAPVRYDQPHLPNYAWPSYAAYPNYAAVTYPKQYSPTAWPYIGPFYPYPQVPLGWRKVSLEWDDGWWMLDFKDRPCSWEGPLGRWY